MPQPLIHIAREGKTMGSFEAGQVSDQLEIGHLRSTDFYYDEEQMSWLPLTEWKFPKESAPPPDSTPPPERTDLSNEERRRGKGKRGRSSRNYKAKKNRPKKGRESALGGWIACLFALAIAAGIWVWAQTLLDREELTDKEIIRLKQQADVLRKEKEILTELTPPDRVRAVITYDVGLNQPGLISGATVALYKREDVEKALRAQELLPISAESFDTDVEKLKTELPTPLSLTVSDADGRVNIPISQPGQYVLMATAAKATKDHGKIRYVWIMGFQVGNEPYLPLLLDEKNAISAGTEKLEIKDVTILASGKTH